MRTMVIAGAAVIAALASAMAGAQAPGSRQTREFVQAAAQSDQFEILEAQTVLGQSADPRVRAFAQQMIADHGRLGAALRDAATQAGLKPPEPGISADQSQLLAGLQGQRGPEFDKTYARHQMLAHRSALVTEQGYAAGGDVPAVRQAATAATPVISSHLRMAQQLQADLGGS